MTRKELSYEYSGSFEPPGAVQTRQRIMQELAGVKAQKDTDAAEEKIEATQDQQDQKPLQESEVEKS